VEAVRQGDAIVLLLWDTTPDDTLLDSAAKGELNTAEGLERVTRRMLTDPRAKDGIDEFVSQWLRFDRVTTASRERRLYPLFSRELAKSMTEESKRFIGDLVWNDRNFMQAFTANYSFINSDLAAVYKMPPPAATSTASNFRLNPSERDCWDRPCSSRFRVSRMKRHRQGADSSCANSSCASRCRLRRQGSIPISPLSRSRAGHQSRTHGDARHQPDVRGMPQADRSDRLRFRKFDAIGMRREKHDLLFYPNLRGVAGRRAQPKKVQLDLDTNGSVAGIAGSEFNNPRQLGEILAKTPQCQECLVKQVFRYMAGRQDTPADRQLLKQATEAFRKSEYRFKELMVALVRLRESEPTEGWQCRK
jgi:hypothetical protein